MKLANLLTKLMTVVKPTKVSNNHQYLSTTLQAALSATLLSITTLQTIEAADAVKLQTFKTNIQSLGE